MPIMLEIAITVRWTVFTFLMLAFVVRFYRLPNSSDKLENFIKAMLPKVFLGSIALTFGIKLILLVLLSENVGKLLTTFEKIYIAGSILTLTFNASLALPEYFRDEVEAREPKADTEESDRN